MKSKRKKKRNKKAKIVEKDWSRLLKGMANLIESKGILFFTKENTQWLYDFILGVYDNSYWPRGDANKRLRVKMMASELYNSLGDFQLNLGFALRILETEKVHAGLRKTRRDDIVMIEGGVFDSLFWLFVGNAWEALYRIWARIEVLLIFFVFNIDVENKLDFRKIKNHRYFDSLVRKIEAEKSQFAVGKEFAELKKSKKKYRKLANLRNDLSHHRSSVLSRFELKDVEYSPIYRPGIGQSWKLTSTFPSAKREITKLVRAYNDAYKTVAAMCRFLKAIFPNRRIIY